RYENDLTRAWTIRQTELLVDLMYQMSECLGYAFDKIQIKNSVYSPVAHGNLEQDQNAIRSGLANILAGKAALPIVCHAVNNDEAKQQAVLRKLLIEYLSGAHPHPVRIVGETPSSS